MFQLDILKSLWNILYICVCPFLKESFIISPDSPWVLCCKSYWNWWLWGPVDWLYSIPPHVAPNPTLIWCSDNSYLLEHLFFSGSLRGKCIGKATSLCGKAVLKFWDSFDDVYMLVLCFLPFFSFSSLFFFLYIHKLHYLMWIKINVPNS